MSDHSLTNEQAAIDAIIEAAESQSLTPYPILGHLTIGYGYDLVERNANVYADFLGIGITLDQNQIVEMDKTTYNNNNIPADISSITITVPDETALLHDAENEAWGTVLASAQTALANTQELVAIEDLGYNPPADGATAAQYLISGNRAQAWIYIRFLANGLYSPGVNPLDGAGGIAARRYMESQVLDLYGSDVDPTGSGTPDFSLGSKFQALAETAQIFQQYTINRNTIIQYDSQFSQTYIAAANSSFGNVLNTSGLDIPNIETTYAALEPAFQYLVNTYAEGVDVAGPGSLEDAEGKTSLDQINIYVDPSDGVDTFVAVTSAFLGNYIIIGGDTYVGQTIQGIYGRTNVIIAPNGECTIDPGSANDVVWGAPSAKDEDGNPLGESTLADC
jgi:hypothetical protein